MNEEAVTVNAELQTRIEDYQTANDDLKNLFDSTQVATIFLDTKLCVRRFTPKSKVIIPLVSTDIGRPIAHFSCALQDVNLSELSKQVLRALDKHEAEICDDQGRYFLLRIQPYRTTNNVIDGVILSFDDVSVRKNSELALINSEKRYKNLFDYSPLPVWEEDCSGLERALQQLREQGISDLGDYLAKNPDETLKLASSKRILALNNAALTLFKGVSQHELLEKLPHLLIQQSTAVLLQQLFAIWNQQEKLQLEVKCNDLQGNVLTLSITWIVTKVLQQLNYANIITTVIPHHIRGLDDKTQNQTE